MKKNKLILGVAALSAILMLTACGDNKTSSSSADSSDKTSQSSSSDKLSRDELNALELPQLEDGYTADEDVVKLKTTMGDITIKLFPKIAPKAVENFMTHAKDGYYNGTKFHRVIEDFMIQGGDPKGDGSGGESIWGEGFDEEYSPQLAHIRGALSMASSGPGTLGSQFFIVQNSEDVHDGLLLDDYPEKMIEAYKKGGVPSLDNHYSVFGQVIEGIDVVDKIAKVEKSGEMSANGEDSKPKEDILIDQIEILQEAK